MLRIPHYLYNRLTDCGEVVSLTHRSRSLIRFLVISVSGINFCYWLSKSQDLIRPKDLGKFVKVYYLIGYQNRDLADCSIVPKPSWSLTCSEPGTFSSNISYNTFCWPLLLLLSITFILLIVERVYS
jgi:hypothetical protein